MLNTFAGVSVASARPKAGSVAAVGVRSQLPRFDPDPRLLRPAGCGLRSPSKLNRPAFPSPRLFPPARRTTSPRRGPTSATAFVRHARNTRPAAMLRAGRQPAPPIGGAAHHFQLPSSPPPHPLLAQREAAPAPRPASRARPLGQGRTLGTQALRDATRRDAKPLGRGQLPIDSRRLWL